MSLIREKAGGLGFTISLALLPAMGILLDGLNNNFGNGLMCLAFSALLAGLLLSNPPPIRFWRRAWPVLATIACAMLWALIGLLHRRTLPEGSVPIAPDLGRSAMIGVAGYVAALLCGAVAGARRVSLAAFIDWLLLFGCAGLMLALAMQGSQDASWIVWDDSDTGRFYGTLSNANASAALYAALGGLALARALDDGDVIWKEREPVARRVLAVFHWLALLLTIGGCILTASRSGMVLAMLALAIVVLQGRRRGRARRRWAPLAIVAVGLVVLWIGFSSLLFDRFGQLPDEVAVRALLWQHNWAVAWRAPLLGFGIGGFPEVNARYLGDVRTAQAIWMTNAPHNVVLRLMIDAGVPYLLLILVAGAAIAAQIGRAVRGRAFDGHEVALLTAIGVMIGSASVDIALEVPALTALTMIWAGLLWGRAMARHNEVGVVLPAFEPEGAERLVAG